MDNYYSVNEYSRITDKDTGNIRRILIEGRLTCEKLCNQRVIKAGNEYPNDARISTGKHLGLRKRVQF